MGQKIKKILNGVSVGRDYIGGNNIVNNYNGYQTETGMEENRDGKMVFLSYN